ncbi:GNAT family N-acetyltransferase [Kaistia algarum]|uniref:GNAT family N-acetyltransferase n=1 Tax=Kaistia algarum TaxID=2083279 RepID=UPI000CE8CD8F|nr:GNAT family protein [Kaistia algarum]MCX5516581.1 GNAT family protein [Kaistia algarum]PPE77518.1 GNAT family N-acetyltransferase [Kaistia algarum]
MTNPPLPIGDEVDTRPAARPSRTRLEGQHVALVPFGVADHARDLFDLSAGSENEGLFAYLAQGPFADMAAFEQYYAAAATKDDPLLFAIVETGSGRAVGHATFMRITPADRVVEVGNILYTPALQRTIGATEAMYLMARHAFEDLGYRRYEWKCNALNAPSRRAALRLGFTFEGIFRQHMIIKAHNRDTAWFSMLDHEWPHAKAAFEAWLDPLNFGPDGRQIRPLESLRA